MPKTTLTVRPEHRGSGTIGFKLKVNSGSDATGTVLKLSVAAVKHLVNKRIESDIAFDMRDAV